MRMLPLIPFRRVRVVDAGDPDRGRRRGDVECARAGRRGHCAVAALRAGAGMH